MKWKALLLLLGLFALITQATAQTPKRAILSIGNGSYQAANNLGSPANDAKMIAQQFVKVGFSAMNNLYFTNQPRSQMLALLAQFEREAYSADIAVFYYSGHGAEFNGDNFLMPTDARPRNRQEFYSQMITTNTVLESLTRSRARVKVIILDACRSDPFKDVSLNSSAGLAKMSAPEGTIVIYATQPGNYSYDGGNGQYSIYTSYLGPQITEPGLDIWTMFNNAATATMRATRDKTPSQQPWLTASPIEGGPIRLNPVRIDVPVASGPPPGVPSVSPTTVAVASRAPQTSTTAEDVEQYVQAGYQLLEQSRWADARAVLTRAISLKDVAHAYSYRAFAWMAEGNALRQQIMQMPNSAERRQKLVDLIQSHYAKVFPDYDHAIEDNDQVAPFHRNRANAVLSVFLAMRGFDRGMKSTLERALVDYKAATLIDPSSKLAFNDLGIGYLYLALYDKTALSGAIKSFNAAIAIDNSYVDPHHGLCRAYAMLNDMPHAQQEAEIAARHASEFRTKYCLQPL